MIHHFIFEVFDLFFSSKIHSFIYCARLYPFLLSSLGFLHSRYHDGQAGSHAINQHVYVCERTKLVLRLSFFPFNLTEEDRSSYSTTSKTTDDTRVAFNVMQMMIDNQTNKLLAFSMLKSTDRDLNQSCLKAFQEEKKNG